VRGGRQSAFGAATVANDIDVGVAASSADECDLRPARRPSGLFAGGDTPRLSERVAAIFPTTSAQEVEAVYLAVPKRTADECQQCSIEGPSGRSSKARERSRPDTRRGRRGKMLGEPASWGRWVHLLGRSASFWKSDTKRLYVQAKLADEGQLCPPREIGARTRALDGADGGCWHRQLREAVGDARRRRGRCRVRRLAREVQAMELAGCDGAN
jgi:hypothetical protein